MKTLRSIVLVLIFSLIFTQVVSAAFTSDVKEVKTAKSASISGTAVATMTVAIKNISGDTTATEVNWTGVALGTTKWKAGAQYMEIVYTANQPGWGIQIGTENKTTSANPKYLGSNDSANGLVGPTGKYRLPMCWRVVDNKITASDEYNIAEYTGTDNYSHLAQDLNSDGVADDQDTGTAGIQGYNCWNYMKDKANDGKSGVGGASAWVEGGGIVTIVDAGGIHHTDAGYGDGWGASPIFVYFGANFTSATINTEYKTNTLFIQLYHQ